MRAINKVDFSVGDSDIPIAIYSAVDGETTFKQISVCCNSPVNYLKICSECKKPLEAEQIKKALEVGDTYKEVDTNALKLESGNLKFLGLIEDNEENGVFKDGSVWYLSPENDKKNKDKSSRALMKFSYLREAFRKAKQSCLCIINLRGKEHLVLLKPHFKCFVGLGLYHFERIRDVTEVGNIDFITQDDVVGQMSEKLKEKPVLAIKDFKDTRNKLLVEMLARADNPETATEKAKEKAIEENPLELVSF